MPLLGSFKVDHTRMHAPAVRMAKTVTTPKDDTITIFDLRFCTPNKEILSEKGIHTLEHPFTGFMRDRLSNDGVEIIDISPTGCHTGFYMSLVGMSGERRVVDAWLASIWDVVNVKNQSKILELNEYQCGTYLMHPLAEAQEAA